MEDDQNFADPTSSARAKRKTILGGRIPYIRPPKKSKTTSKKTTPTISDTPNVISTPLVDITNHQKSPPIPNNTQPLSSQFNHVGKQKNVSTRTTPNINLLNKFLAVDTNVASTSSQPIPQSQSPFETKHDQPNLNDDDHVLSDDNNDDEQHDACDSDHDELQASDASSDSEDDFELGEDNFQIGNVTFEGTIFINTGFHHHVSISL
jgi:hypothetical protein